MLSVRSMPLRSPFVRGVKPAATVRSLAAGGNAAVLRHEIGVAFAEDAVAAQVAVLHVQPRIVDAEPLLELQQFATCCLLM